MKELINNAKSVFTRNGATNHSNGEREKNDYYATEPKAVDILLNEENFNHHIWECACGGGHISDVLKKHGYDVKSSDLYDRGYIDTELLDFLKVTRNDVIKEGTYRDIITNPPYKYAKEFVEHALDISLYGTKIAMFLKLTFLESKARKKLFEKYPPKIVYVSSSRLQCAKNGDFEKYGKGVGTAVAYAWFVWQKGYKGNTIIRWVN